MDASAHPHEHAHLQMIKTTFKTPSKLAFNEIKSYNDPCGHFGSPQHAICGFCYLLFICEQKVQMTTSG